MIAGLTAMILGTSALGMSARAQQAPMIMPMSEFQLEMRAALLKADPKLKVDLVGEDTLKVNATDDPEDALSLFLDNAYDRYRNKPDQLQAIIGQLTRLLVQKTDRLPLEASRLVVLIRPEDYVRSGGGVSVEQRPLVGDFLEVLAVDEGESFRLATQDELAKAGVPAADAWASARRNTGEKIGPFTVNTLEPGVWFVTDSASLALNLVSMPERWAAQGIEVKDEAAVVFLQRNVLLIADTSDPARLSRFLRFVQGSAGEPEVISTDVFLYRHGNWSVLERSK
ncbi:hypothetical protein G5B46_12070 [Caulobacter sp. 602-2]|uniref:DUF1444 family protein n=1 Tax=Caulobacter sp. 602-2 TaxID=2710887 RepID=A0A6G4QXG8_9CAUL|nr:hypothetical protein [Caulobacter sp. 602-2]NGM50346.1 hypothetical protein [Caulobacter sp. 602-2]